MKFSFLLVIGFVLFEGNDSSILELPISKVAPISTNGSNTDAVIQSIVDVVSTHKILDEVRSNMSIQTPQEKLTQLSDAYKYAIEHDVAFPVVPKKIPPTGSRYNQQYSFKPKNRYGNPVIAKNRYGNLSSLGVFNVNALTFIDFKDNLTIYLDNRQSHISKAEFISTILRTKNISRISPDIWSDLYALTGNLSPTDYAAFFVQLLRSNPLFFASDYIDIIFREMDKVHYQMFQINVLNKIFSDPEMTKVVTQKEVLSEFLDVVFKAIKNDKDAVAMLVAKERDHIEHYPDKGFIINKIFDTPFDVFDRIGPETRRKHSTHIDKFCAKSRSKRGSDSDFDFLTDPEVSD